MARTPWRPPALDAVPGAVGLPLSLSLTGGGELEAAQITWKPSHRVIASEYANENLFDRLAGDEEFAELRAIADLTNPHVLAEMGTVEHVHPDDRVYGPGAGLVMAAFAWPGAPSRFSDGTCGTYYAARLEETAVRETAYHDEVFLRGSGPVVLEKTLVQAELDGTLVDVRSGCPAPAGLYHPSDYAVGQGFGAVVRRLDGDGVVYDSVRHRDGAGRALGECAAVFRPAVLRHAVAARTLEYRWDGSRVVRVR